MLSKENKDMEREQNRRYTPYIDGAKIRVAFLCQLPNLWYNFKSLIRSCQESSDITTQVILAPCPHPMIGAKQLNEMKEILLNQNIPFYNYNHYCLENFRPHLIFVQMPYDEQLPPEFSTEKILQNGCRICYIQYGNEIYGGLEGIKNNFNLPLIQKAWRIFARSEKHRKLYGRYCSVGNGHVALTGHPKVDKMVENARPSQKIIDVIRGRTTILWAPTYIDDNPPSWSAFLEFYDVILREFENNRDLFLIIRPHPLLRITLTEQGIWDVTKVEEFYQRIKKSENILIDESPDYYGLFTISDALMADICSFLISYVVTKKPILYLQQSLGLGSNDDEQIIENFYQASKEQDVKNFLDMIVKKSDPMKEQRLKAIEEHFYNIDGKSGERIRDHIVNSLKGGDDSIIQQKNNHSFVMLNFWQNADTCFIHEAEHVEKKKAILIQILKDIPAVKYAADMGCGNGLFTEMLASVSQNVMGYDISSKFIAEAEQQKQEKKISNISYHSIDFFDIVPRQKFSLTACLDVTSSIIDDIDLITFLDRIPVLLEKRGWLLICDTFSCKINTVGSSPAIKYRIEQDFIALIQSKGFSLVKSYHVTQMDNLTSKFHLFKLV